LLPYTDDILKGEIKWPIQQPQRQAIAVNSAGNLQRSACTAANNLPRVKKRKTGVPEPAF
jgi:hypothetical protein